ncbi:MAG: hypothetical protein HRU40_09975 [Saprospiraceae bacterium]|nr:hypothetical protein [Saprospiraceae bacterium]
MKYLQNQVILLIDLVLYSNLWIALGALFLTLQTRWLLLGTAQLTVLDGFIMCATLFVYAVHRIIALQKQKNAYVKKRFRTIARRRVDISFYALLAAVGSVIFFFQLPAPIQVSTIVPAMLSILYVMPIFRGKKRLRDFNYLKVFLVAIVWTWVTVILPATDQAVLELVPTKLIALERFLFIFAITIPFDIRDLHLDQAASVRTLPTKVGLKKARILSLTLLFLACVIAFYLYHLDTYSLPVWCGWMCSALLAVPLIIKAHPHKHDYYFTGLIDGLMIIQFTLMYTLAQL